jgi:hypothetical protein
MPTGFAKNVGASALVVLAIVVAILVFCGSTGTVSTTPESASYSPTPVTVPYGITAPPAVDCPIGAAATAPPGPIPSAVSTGFKWTPSRYPTTGWCEVAG